MALCKAANANTHTKIAGIQILPGPHKQRATHGLKCPSLCSSSNVIKCNDKKIGAGGVHRRASPAYDTMCAAEVCGHSVHPYKCGGAGARAASQVTLLYYTVQVVKYY
jgi:hypothetical protein